MLAMKTMLGHGYGTLKTRTNILPLSLFFFSICSFYWTGHRNYRIKRLLMTRSLHPKDIKSRSSKRKSALSTTHCLHRHRSTHSKSTIDQFLINISQKSFIYFVLVLAPVWARIAHYPHERTCLCPSYDFWFFFKQEARGEPSLFLFLSLFLSLSLSLGIRRLSLGRQHRKRHDGDSHYHYFTVLCNNIDFVWVSGVLGCQRAIASSLSIYACQNSQRVRRAYFAWG